MYVTCLLSRFMQSPIMLHFTATKRILKYVKGTADFGLMHVKHDKRELVIVAMIGQEAEYIAIVSVVNQLKWLRQVLANLGFKQENGTVIFVDNQSAIAIAKNPVYHSTEVQPVDILTKGLSKERFETLRTRLGVC
ncbi:Uncharacterized protein TCM_013806 [Theobroma cacao]|uniref:Cysteine-rich RLK (RECEPTOR-like protein kinase) 8 n=1 Tax=Theobroma cacao TaxID=3641 RepID=A0A061G3Y2_THECC|nr:Uncharacterized protein TCM_013806 [Theobroma cacao]